MSIKTIAFFFPYHEVSGVPVLFLNLANYFSQNYQFKISIIDFEDGYMSSSLKENDKIEKIIFETSKPLFIDLDIVIMQSILPFAMRPEIQFSTNTRLMFWNLYPDNLTPNLYPFVIVRKYYPNIYRNILSIFWKRKLKLMRDFVENAIQLNSLSFMDSSNLNTTNFFLSTDISNVSFLPIACSNGVKREEVLNKDFTELNFSWIGRICDFKINILNYLILKLSEAAKKLKLKVNLHVIGDGPLIHKLNSNNYLHKFFNVILLGTLDMSKMNLYLNSKIDINASMGTSVLESAKFGIPSIVLDISNKPINFKYKFRWLHDTKNYDLAHLIKKSDDMSKSYELTDIISEFIVNSKILSEKSFNYYASNHSLEAVSENLKKQIEKSKLTFTDINPELLKKSLLRRLYEYKKYKL
tara:strand:- start:4272 stop:5507 length:1236 start_codon:yes stop_codon:yes gene_type:complete